MANAQASAQLSETLIVRFPEGQRERIRSAAQARAQRIGVAARLPMSEFIRSAVAQAIEQEERGGAKAGALA